MVMAIESSTVGKSSSDRVKSKLLQRCHRVGIDQYSHQSSQSLSGSVFVANKKSKLNLSPKIRLRALFAIHAGNQVILGLDAQSSKMQIRGDILQQ